MLAKYRNKFKHYAFFKQNVDLVQKLDWNKTKI